MIVLFVKPRPGFEFHCQQLTFGGRSVKTEKKKKG